MADIAPLATRAVLLIRTKRTIIGILALCIMVLFFRGLHSPLFYASASRDSGVFLYIGQRILAGEIPYLDVWDHKMPAIMYVNALGILLNSDRWWGVWLLESVFLISAATTSFYAFRARFSAQVAFVVTGMWISTTPALLSGGNFTEGYGLAFQFLLILSLLYPVKDGSTKARLPRYIFIGMLMGILFLFRQNLIGIGVAAFVSILIENSLRLKVRNLVQLGWIFAGTTLVLIPSALLLIGNGAFRDFLSAAFSYNFAYSSATLSQRLITIGEAVVFTAEGGLAVLASVGWLASFMPLTKNLASDNDFVNLRTFVVVGLPIELIFVSVTGLAYEHYYITLLPMQALCAAIALSKTLNWTKAHRYYVIPIMFIVSIMIPSLLMDFRSSALRMRSGQDQSLNRIQQFVADEDINQLLVWGANPYINYITQTTPGSRFVYQYPLVMRGYADDELVAEMLNDLENLEYIIDASAETGGFNQIPSMDPNSRQTWYESAPTTIRVLWEPLLRHLDTNFVPSISLGRYQLYRRNSNQ